jgi:hypothetical protein
MMKSTIQSNSHETVTDYFTLLAATTYRRSIYTRRPRLEHRSDSEDGAHARRAPAPSVPTSLNKAAMRTNCAKRMFTALPAVLPAAEIQKKQIKTMPYI